MNYRAASREIPRLLYIADVPVEATYHGSLLLFRLLQSYPADRLFVVEGSVLVSEPQRRLAGVAYRVIDAGVRRILLSRFSTHYSSWLTLRASKRARRVSALLDGFSPDVVLTVAHGTSWLTAAEFARSRGLPLHLIVHDDLPRIANVLPRLREWLEERFATVYSAATSRLCVSRYMEAHYYEHYKTRGSVLSPSRSLDCPRLDVAPEKSDRALTFGYAGSVNTAGYSSALRSLALCLQQSGGRLLIFGPISDRDAQQTGLDMPNVIRCGLIEPQEVIARLRDEADVLYLPMSFAEGDRPNMQLSFPSKLTDYTAAGLPLLIHGPSYCSAVRWAAENQDAALVVTDTDPDALKIAVEKLIRDAELRRRLARGALAVGTEDFSHKRAFSTLMTALQAGRSFAN